MSENLSAQRNDAEFAALAPKVEAMLAKPQKMQTLKLWGARERMPSKQIEEVVFWLELQGRARSFRSFDGAKRYVLAGAQFEDDQRASPAPEAAQKETTVAKSETITVGEAAEILGCTTQNVRQVGKRGHIKCAKVDGEWRYERASVEAWKARGPKGSKPNVADVPARAATAKAKPPLQPRPSPSSKPVKPPPKRVERAAAPSAPASPGLAEKVRALLQVHAMDVLDAETTLSHIATLVS